MIKHLTDNIYPGRGIVVGIDKDNQLIILYWIMGRSSNSRNRIFVYNKKSSIFSRRYKRARAFYDFLYFTCCCVVYSSLLAAAAADPPALVFSTDSAPSVLTP